MFEHVWANNSSLFFEIGAALLALLNTTRAPRQRWTKHLGLRWSRSESLTHVLGGSWGWGCPHGVGPWVHIWGPKWMVHNGKSHENGWNLGLPPLNHWTPVASMAGFPSQADQKQKNQLSGQRVRRSLRWQWCSWPVGLVPNCHCEIGSAGLGWDPWDWAPRGFEIANLSSRNAAKIAQDVTVSFMGGCECTLFSDHFPHENCIRSPYVGGLNHPCLDKHGWYCLWYPHRITTHLRYSFTFPIAH